MDDESYERKYRERREGEMGGEKWREKNTYLVLFQLCYQTLNESENGVLVVLLD